MYKRQEFLWELKGITDGETFIPFQKPMGIHVDGKDTLYVADSEAKTVYHLEKNGRLLKKLETCLLYTSMYKNFTDSERAVMV